MAKTKAAKKKVAKTTSAKKKAAKASGAAVASWGVDLEEMLSREGVDHHRIPEALAFIRTLSDAQAAGDATPRDPRPAPLGSPAEMLTAGAADAIAEETERCQARTKRAIQRRTSNMQGRRDTFWDLEVTVPGAPRSSFVGRAINETASDSQPAESPAIYDAIFRANQDLLPPSLQLAVQTLRLRLEEGRTTPEQNNTASSAVTKNLSPRITLLVERLQYAEEKKKGRTRQYRLTRLGKQIFEKWPEWDKPGANPWTENPPATGSVDTPTDVT